MNLIKFNLSLVLTVSLLAPVAFGQSGGASWTVQGNPDPGRQASQPQAPAKYSFLFIYKDPSPQTDAMWGVFQSALQKASDRANPFSINLNDPASAQYVSAYNLGNPATPLVLSVAPNGAVMGVFSQQFTEQQLLGAFGTPAQEAAQLSLTQGKMVMLCFQNERTQFNQEAISGVNAFLQDPRFQNYASAVMVNPADPREASLVQQLQVNPNTPSAMTVMMTPPGAPVATFNGPTTKDALIGELKLQGGCGPACQCLESVPEGGDSKPVLSKFFGKIAGKFKG